MGTANDKDKTIRRAARDRSPTAKTGSRAARSGPAKPATRKPRPAKRGAARTAPDDAAAPPAIPRGPLPEPSDPAAVAPTNGAGKPKKHKGKTAAPSGLRQASDLEIDPDVLEFIAAIDRYKKNHSRPFPSWSEILYILRQLGYTKPRSKAD
jgi:hypothetical protein